MTDPALSLDALWDFGDPVASEERFRDWLERRGPSGDPELHAAGLTQLARALGLQGRFEEAELELERAESLIASIPSSHARVRGWLERGRLLNSSDRPHEALPHFVAAWEAARALGLDGLAVDAAHMAAIAASPPDQLAWNERALDLARSSPDPSARKWVGSLLNNLAWTLHDAGKAEQALRLFEEALEVRLRQGTPANVRIARWSVARAKRTLGRVEEALSEQLELRSSIDATESDGYIEEEIGECLLALGRGDEARPHFADAHRILSADPWLAQHEPERLERMRRLAESG